MPNRRWFQIHLSTAIVMMFVAGSLIWANVRHEVRFVEGEGSIVYELMKFHNYGWPFSWHTAVEQTLAIGVVEKNGEVYVAQGDLSATNPNFYWQTINWVGLTLDVFIGLVIIIIVMLGCERYIRYRESCKP